MELYSINIHFVQLMVFTEPLTYTLTHTDYYENDIQAARAAKVLRQKLRNLGSFVFWLESLGADIVWTDQPQEVKEIIQFKLLRKQPMIRSFEELLR